MSRHLAIVGTITIPSGQTNGSWLVSKLAFGYSADMIIYAPLTLSGVCTVQVSHKENPAAADIGVLSVKGAPVTIAAGAAEVIPTSSFKAIRIQSAGAEAAARVFTVCAQMDM